jgi:RNA polymerase sporulation-specific sigma factor
MRLSGDIVLPREPALTQGEVSHLIARAKRGDSSARDELGRRNLRLVMSVVRRFISRGGDQEDLFQIGCIGLMKAIDRFEPERGFAFSTFAVPVIFGEIQSFLRDEHPVKISRSLKAMAAVVYRSRESLAHELGREPTLAEIARRCDMGEDQVVEALDAALPPVSLQEIVYEDDGKWIERSDSLTSGIDESVGMVETVALRQVLAELPERERWIIESRFFGEKTQCQVAETLGISQVQVSRLERRALERLKDLFG